jgi:hypothetical protein
VLVAASAAGMLATIRSRCQRVAFALPPPRALRAPDAPEDEARQIERFDAMERTGLPELLDWAEEFRGERARAAEQVHVLLRTGSEWLRERVRDKVEAESNGPLPELDAFRALSSCRKDLDQRNANPQMVAERALFAMREAIAR